MYEIPSHNNGPSEIPFTGVPAAPYSEGYPENSPHQNEITVPSDSGPPPQETSGETVEAREAQRLLKEFDNNRIDWGWGRRIVGHDRSELGYDSRNPQYIVRRDIRIAGADASPEEIAQGREAFYTNVRDSEAEMRRLVAGTSLRIPLYHHILPPYPLEDRPGTRAYNGYTYVQRLDGVELNPSDPEHTPHALTLGKAAVHYLTTTPPGGRYTSEYILPSQWTIGRPYIAAARTEQQLYLHDIETAGRLDIRPPLHPEDPTIPEGYDAFEDYESYIGILETTSEWVRGLQPSPERDELLRTLESLRLPY